MYIKSIINPPVKLLTHWPTINNRTIFHIHEPTMFINNNENMLPGVSSNAHIISTQSIVSKCKYLINVN